MVSISSIREIKEVKSSTCFFKLFNSSITSCALFLSSQKSSEVILSSCCSILACFCSRSKRPPKILNSLIQLLHCLFHFLHIHLNSSFLHFNYHDNVYIFYHYHMDMVRFFQQFLFSQKVSLLFSSLLHHQRRLAYFSLPIHAPSYCEFVLSSRI